VNATAISFEARKRRGGEGEVTLFLLSRQRGGEPGGGRVQVSKRRKKGRGKGKKKSK